MTLFGLVPWPAQQPTVGGAAAATRATSQPATAAAYPGHGACELFPLSHR